MLVTSFKTMGLKGQTVYVDMGSDWRSPKSWELVCCDSIGRQYYEGGWTYLRTRGQHLNCQPRVLVFIQNSLIILSFVHSFIHLIMRSFYYSLIFIYLFHKLHRHNGGSALIQQYWNDYCRSRRWSYTASWTCKQVLTAILWTRKWHSTNLDSLFHPLFDDQGI